MFQFGREKLYVYVWPVLVSTVILTLIELIGQGNKVSFFMQHDEQL